MRVHSKDNQKLKMDKKTCRNYSRDKAELNVVL